MFEKTDFETIIINTKNTLDSLNEFSEFDTFIQISHISFSEKKQRRIAAPLGVFKIHF